MHLYLNKNNKHVMWPITHIRELWICKYVVKLLKYFLKISLEHQENTLSKAFSWQKKFSFFGICLISEFYSISPVFLPEKFWEFEMFKSLRVWMFESEEFKT